MTEADWLTSSDPDRMLAFLRPTLSSRKSRLFACGVARQLWEDLIADPRSQGGVEIAEAYADSLADEKQLRDAEYASEAAWDEVCEQLRQAMMQTRGKLRKQVKAAMRRVTAARAAVVCAAEDWLVKRHHPLESTWCGPDYELTAMYACYDLYTECYREQHGLLRDIFGNPFRPVALDPACLTPAVTSLARTMYDARDFDDMPVLGDALEDAGCSSDDVLSHCRGEHPHVRGCWLVDLLLGKS